MTLKGAHDNIQKEGTMDRRDYEFGERVEGKKEKTPLICSEECRRHIAIHTAHPNIHPALESPKTTPYLVAKNDPPIGRKELAIFLPSASGLHNTACAA